MTGKKFLQVVDRKIYENLSTLAKQQGITVQQLVRARIIPEWAEGPLQAYQRGYKNGYKAGRRIRRDHSESIHSQKQP